ncbi:MAG: hypothetical protein L0I76_33595, partial [Pseudonocardia sp.]|nr:hypothetical protein [Pseudonocardia sp.]
GSPADENATRPLPRVRPAGAGRAGTAISPAVRNGSANGTSRSGPANGTSRNSAADGISRNGSANGRGVQRPNGRPQNPRNGLPRNAHPRNVLPQNGHPRNGRNGSPGPGLPPSDRGNPSDP